MPRPKSKEGLLIAKRENYQKLMVLVDSYSPKEQEKDFPPGTLNRNIRDVFGHLYHWQILFVGWYTTGMKGENPNIPAKGYNWTGSNSLAAYIIGATSSHYAWAHKLIKKCKKPN